MNTKIKTVVVCGLMGLLGVGGFYLRNHLSVMSKPSTNVSASPSMPVSPKRPFTVRMRERPAAMTLTSPRPELNKLLANLKTALYTPPEDNRRGYPPNDVMDAIRQFTFSEHEQVFVCLKEAASDPNAEVRDRAISAMRALSADNTPGLVAFLWQTLKTSALSAESSITPQLALNSLNFGGYPPFPNPPGLISANDIPALLEVLSSLPDKSPSQFHHAGLRQQISQIISQFLERDGEVAAQYLPELEIYLNHTNPGVRLDIACVLAKQEAATNPKVLQELTIGIQNLSPRTSQRAIETLAELGPTAKPVLPDLLAFAGSNEGKLKASALQAAGKIDPDLRRTNPEVDQALTELENEQVWAEAYHSKTLDLNQLQTALSDPRHAVAAALRLGQMGNAAMSTLPIMIAALDFNPPGRDEILAQIRRIDPDTRIEQFNRDVLFEAFHAVAQADVLTKGQFNKFNQLSMKAGDQWTKGEVVKFSDQLASDNPPAWRVFINKIAEQYPNLATSLQTAQQP